MPWQTRPALSWAKCSSGRLRRLRGNLATSFLLDCPAKSRERFPQAPVFNARQAVSTVCGRYRRRGRYGKRCTALFGCVHEVGRADLEKKCRGSLAGFAFMDGAPPAPGNSYLIAVAVRRHLNPAGNTPPPPPALSNRAPSVKTFLAKPTSALAAATAQ